jgi:hypothetical protein
LDDRCWMTDAEWPMLGNRCGMTDAGWLMLDEG